MGTKTWATLQLFTKSYCLLHAQLNSPCANITKIYSSAQKINIVHKDKNFGTGVIEFCLMYHTLFNQISFLGILDSKDLSKIICFLLEYG